LIRPERYQAAAPMLPGKEKESFDVWVIFSKIVTFWAPGALLSSLGGLHDEQSQQAWREKVTLCFIAVVMGSTVAFLTVGFAAVLCPPDQASNPQLFKRFGEAPVDFKNLSTTQNSQDITNFFFRDNSKIPGCQDPMIQRFAAVAMPLCVNATSCPLNPINETTFKSYNIDNTTKKVGFDWSQVGNMSNYLVIDGNVLNLQNYIAYQKQNDNDTMDVVIRKVLNSTHVQGGRDATRLFFGRADLKAAVNCLVNKYYAGNIDKQTIGCFTSELFLYVSLTVILSIVLCRFIMACIFDWFISHRLAHEPKVKSSNASNGSKPWVPGTSTVRKGMTMDDVGKDLFTVLLVTCYSEDEVGIKCTCESMASTDYPDDRKLLFLICDGIIVGSGNEKSTPDICVGLMEL
ncbi:3059_t:CDS:2, partial [Cetraspora pellucida]